MVFGDTTAKEPVNCSVHADIFDVSGELNFIDPTTAPYWDEVVERSKLGFFYSRAWAKVLSESYGFLPIYIAEIIDSQFETLIPLMEIHSRITGKRAVSLPFTDVCEPVFSDPTNAEALLEAFSSYAKQKKWKYLECRGGAIFFSQKSIAATYYLHRVDLDKGLDRVFSDFRENVRRNIRKAKNHDVRVRFDNSLSALREYFRLHCLTRSRHGLPPQPFRFFKKLFEHVLSRDKGFVALAYNKDIAIAGAVYFYFANEAIYKFGASDAKFSQLGANTLVMWTAIEKLVQHGCSVLNLGRTDLAHKGLRHFKLGWGVEERSVDYFHFGSAPKSMSKFRLDYRTKRIMSWLPISFLRLLGTASYRHLA